MKIANSHQLHYRRVANPRRQEFCFPRRFVTILFLISSLLVATRSHLAAGVGAPPLLTWACHREAVFNSSSLVKSVSRKVRF